MICKTTDAEELLVEDVCGELGDGNWIADSTASYLRLTYTSRLVRCYG